MKTLFPLFFGPALLLAGCVFLDDGLNGPRSRADCARPGAAQGVRPAPADSLPGAVAGPDTVLYFSAVRFPGDYDWQRDSAYGSAAFELMLFRDGRPVLTLASGPGVPFVPDPDRHHILSGHLYTERMLDGETLIGRDGLELFRFAGREFLLGLLEDGGDLHTLSRPANGQGFRYRKNGEILLDRTDGTPYGSLSDPSYGASGALYRDEGQICFCFREGRAGNHSHFMVRDGSEMHIGNILPSQTVLDIKLHRGRVLTLYNEFLRHRLSDGRLWPRDGVYGVTGRFSDGAGAYFSGFLEPRAMSVQNRLCDEEAALYCTAEAAFAVSADRDGTVRWYGPEEAAQSGTPCYFFSPACAAAAGKRFFLALTPKDRLRKAQIRTGAQTEEIDLWGYVSRVAVEIHPPAS